MKRILIILTVALALLLCVSAVSADENATAENTTVHTDVGVGDVGAENQTAEKVNTTIEVKKIVSYTTFKTEFSAKLKANSTPLT